MKCMIPEISWHNREPILCVDIQPVENDFYRLATGGSDYHVLIWQGRITGNGAVTLDIVSDLTRHQRAVNVVRWSSNGQYLASADDDANIIVWNLKSDNIPLLEGETSDKEIWVITKIMRGHKEDVYDLCWSPNGLKIISGSIDNTAIVWDFTKGKLETILSDHKGFVQGVSWDPKGEYIATLSSDRVCRIYEANSKQIRARIRRGVLPVSKLHPLYMKDVKYFHDDTFKSFFRRITFTPDGNLIVAPAGCVETEDSKKVMFGTYLFTLDSLTQPVAILPLEKQCSVAVRCCPILFELRPDGPDPIVNLPYRMIIAVATESDIILYDTQQLTPFAHLQKFHYTRLTDLSWSIDGRLLTACSTDGFCTLVTFEPDELGIPYVKEESEIEECSFNVSGCEELEKDTVEIKSKEEKPKKESFLLQWASKVKEDDKINANRSMETDTNEESKENKNENNKILSDKIEENTPEKVSNVTVLNPIETIEILDSPEKTAIVKTPKRIVPKRLTTPNNKSKKGSTPTTKSSTPIRKKGKNIDASQSKEITPNCLTNFLKVATPTCNSINITEDSTNARDAWNTESIKNSTEKMDTEVDDLTEPIPDFKLQLEESILQENKDNCSKSIIVQDVDMSINLKKPVEKLKTSTTNEKNIKSCPQKSSSLIDNQDKHNEEIKELPTSSSSNVRKAESQKNIDNILLKPPRRIQLITLSSPKHKREGNNT